MTKEELKQEAEEYAEERCKDCYMCSADGKRNKCHFYTKRVEGYLASAEPREKRIAELEEKFENAESSNEWYRRSTYGSLFDQLTKAKEIIKDLLGSENTSCEEEMFFEIRQKAEQFLKGEK